MDIFYDNSFNNNEDFDLNQEFIVEDEIKQLREKYFPKETASFDESVQKKDQNTEAPNYTNAINEMIKDFEELSKKKIKKKSNSNVKILSEI